MDSKRLVVSVQPFDGLTPEERKALERQAKSYGEFLGLEGTLEMP